MTSRPDLAPGARVVVYRSPVLRRTALGVAELLERLGPAWHRGAGVDRWRARLGGEEREILVDCWNPEVAA